MEAGEVAQNMTLMATSLGLGALLLGGFIDNRLSDLLDVDGYDEAPLLPIVIGRKPAAAPTSGT
jgi:nitroreductase